MEQKKRSFMFFLNLGLTFTLVGIIISFFIFSYEKNYKKDEFLVHAQAAPEKTSFTGSLDGALAVENAIRDVVDKNMPAVVNISTEIEAGNTQEDRYADEFFRFFFGDQMPRQKRSQKSLGSGFIINEEGYVLSNYHVVKGATKIMITLYGEDGELPAKLIGYDEAYDLALLKIEDENRTFPYVALGDSDAIEPGEFAIAIGNPYGLNNTVTFGIVSAKGRSDVGANKYQRYIQTDVAINPGNSGGPLFNIHGQVIGINTLIYSTSGGSIGIGFATPINLATSVMTDLKENGRVTRGYLGIYLQDIDENLSRGLNVKQNSGVYVSEVVPDSPAAKGGLQDGDIIIEYDGERMTKSGDLFNKVATTKVGKEVNVKYLRNGRERSTKITIEARVEDEEVVPTRPSQNNSQSSTRSWMGLDVSNITPEISQRLQIRSNERGVVVLNMTQNSKAYQYGLRPGDVIKAINGITISNTDDYDNFVKSYGNDKSFTITIKRARMTYVIIIE
ncbi:DegQ family serine endoprotease [Brachyspira hampsonii]|uniref:Peptidase n=1 Tax=Brachyspira hampsonii TaxID=1287055 RepID=A0AAC9TV58_9SPIR|nr:DegQ family serine endoprotease [Brachyspira hampsonii]ASJ21817.1 peptidase [Brachyspira hampsonii]ELV05740.1 serine endoprotease [Brachyspira hampsonii 30599]MBW5380258.1 DegQ family serine endoprotease [Brachyspira hampsonii]MBW5409895.1 DegQ family serine endoprotease [Brachyspira hampsonii]OEJ17394.1 peptidase [Brachyspira hampsonii]